MMHDSIDTALTNHRGLNYWGVDPEAILLYNNVIMSGTSPSVGTSALRRHYELNILETNYDPGWTEFVESVAALRNELLTDPLDQAALFATAADARTFVVGAAYQNTPSGVAAALERAQERLGNDDSDDEVSRVTLSDQEIRSYTSAGDRRLLVSLGAMQPTAAGYAFDTGVLRTLLASTDQTRSQAAWVTLSRCLSAASLELETEQVSQLLSALDFSLPQTPPDRSRGSLPVYIGDNRLQPLVSQLFTKEFRETLAELLANRRTRQIRIADAYRPSPSVPSTVADCEWPLSTRSAAVCATMSQRGLGIIAKWVAEQEDTDPPSIVYSLTDAEFEVELVDGILRFDTGYESPSETDTPEALEQYSEWVASELSATTDDTALLRQVKMGFQHRWKLQRRALLENSVRRFEDFSVEPITFVYTLFDPDHHSDEYSVEQYIGESDALEAEVHRIRQWLDSQEPADAARFTSSLREVINAPLEEDGVAPIVRIMTPYVNYIVKEYVAMVERLLQNDVTVRLLFRLPDGKEWSGFQQRFLNRIGDTNGNLELRTYSRYAKYRTHTELQEMDDQDRKLKQTGVHGKLYIAGEAPNGHVLAGSANLMENSFYYNPEAGLQTQHPSVVRTAVDYFDLVWEIAEPGKIPEEVFREDTEYQYFPDVYRP
jgi:hypothetical protein